MLRRLLRIQIQQGRLRLIGATYARCTPPNVTHLDIVVQVGLNAIRSDALTLPDLILHLKVVINHLTLDHPVHTVDDAPCSQLLHILVVGDDPADGVVLGDLQVDVADESLLLLLARDHDRLRELLAQLSQVFVGDGGLLCLREGQEGNELGDPSCQRRAKLRDGFCAKGLAEALDEFL